MSATASADNRRAGRESRPLSVSARSETIQGGWDDE
jgi:hypothetical protein